MPTIGETKAAKSKALRALVKQLKTGDKRTKIKALKLLGMTVRLGVKVETEQTAINAVQTAVQDKKWSVRRAAKKALKEISATKRMSPNPLDMFDGGVGFSSKK